MIGVEFKIITPIKIFIFTIKHFDVNVKNNIGVINKNYSFYVAKLLLLCGKTTPLTSQIHCRSKAQIVPKKGLKRFIKRY